MRWPLMFRATHRAAVAEAQSAVALANYKAAQAEAQVEYWRRRAELFIDRASAKAGITHEPVMHEMQIPVDPYANNPFGGMGVQFIDSSKE